jgi:hypothetical protein
MKQFIIIGTADSNTETELCLLTRRVFTSIEGEGGAQAFAETCCNARNPQIVECYFPVPDSLYKQDWISSCFTSEEHLDDTFSDTSPTLRERLEKAVASVFGSKWH